MLFIDNKYSGIYFKIINNAKARNLPFTIYTEQHHIIPKSAGGDNSISNLVRLTAREHFVCHKLLVKMTTGRIYYKMLEALVRFSTNNNRSLSFTSRDFSLLREANSIASSNRNIGNQYYKNRKPYGSEYSSVMRDKAKESKWANNGKHEIFSPEHLYYVDEMGYQYGRLPFSKEWIEKITTNSTARLHTIEANAKRIISLTGKKKSETHCENLSNAAKALPDKTCEHCSTVTNLINYKRWHGDNCKNISKREKFKCECCGFECTNKTNYVRWHGANCKHQ